MRETRVLALCMIAAVTSFLGFVVENIWLTATKGYIDNRNMCFPFLLGYGIAILLILAILGTPEKLWFFGKVIPIKSKFVKTVIYFFGVMICISVGEIALGTFVEKTCHFCWWDYNTLRTTALLLCAIMVGDFLYSSFRTYLHHGMIQRWCCVTKGSLLYRKLHDANL